MRKWGTPLALLAVAAGAAIIASPRAQTEPGPTVDELVQQAGGAAVQSRDLIDEAIRLTASAYTHYSAWHLWEGVAASLRHRRGWSHQYNAALAAVLEGLGFRTRMVHTAWVQGADHPWWHNGHTWVKVLVDGRWLDACASRSTNRVGELPVTPGSEELPYHPRTRMAVTLSLTPFVVAGVWRAWLTRRPVPGWIYRERFL